MAMSLTAKCHFLPLSFFLLLNMLLLLIQSTIGQPATTTTPSSCSCACTCQQPTTPTCPGQTTPATTQPTTTAPFNRGFDSPTTNGPITVANFQTANAAGYRYFIGQYFNGTAVSDPNSYNGLAVGINNNGIASINNANDVAAIANVDAYHLPIYVAIANINYPGQGTRTNVYSQARRPIDALNSAGAQIGRTWIVCVQSVGGWSTTQAANQAFLTEFLRYFPSPLGPQVGILTNMANFQALFGTTYQPKDSNGNQVALWWQNCNGNTNTNGFVAFNGWTAPAQKRYNCVVSNIGGVAGMNGNDDVIF